jgi:hypothetical protein
MKTYHGGRDPVAGCVVTYRRGGAEATTPLPTRFDLYDHSPTGFDRGHNGAGPAQLALALLAALWRFGRTLHQSSPRPAPPVASAACFLGGRDLRADR